MSPLSRCIVRLGYAPAIIVPRIAAFASVLIFTRWLSPEDFGRYALVIVMGEALDSVFLNWSRLGLQRFHHATGADTADLRRRASRLLIAGICAGVIAAALLSVSSPGTASWEFFGVLVLYFVGAGMLRYALNLLRANELVAPYVLIETARPLLGILVAWGIVANWRASFEAVSIGTFGAALPAALIGFVIMRRCGGSSAGDKPADMRAFFAYALPLIAVFVASQAISSSDRLLLSIYGGPALVGIYASSAALARPVIETIFNAINTSAFPRLIRAFEAGGDQAAIAEMRRILASLIVVGLPAVVGIWLIAEPMVELLLDERYHSGAAWIMRISALSSFIAGLKAFYSDQVFHLRRTAAAQVWTLLPGSAVAIGMSSLLIPRWGGIGAALAMLAGYLVAALWSAMLAHRLLPVNPPRALIVRAITACAFMATVGAWVPWEESLLGLALLIAACAGTYFAACAAFGVHHRFAAVAK